MNCPACGEELQDTHNFCSACGARVAAAPEEPAVEEMPVITPVDEAPAAEEIPAILPAEETPVTETEPEETADLSEEDAESFDDIMKEAAALIGDIEDLPEEETPAEEKTAVYSNPVPHVKKTKKPRKLLAILIPIIVVVLLAGAAFGFYMWAENTYEQATACLQEKDYAQALELYGKFSFYKDCQEQIDHLNLLQESYDNASALLEMHEYVKAKATLQALGDYRDSRDLLMYRAPYQQAQYLMACAGVNDASALPQHPAYQEGAAYEEDVTVFLYEGAAEIFLSLGEYEDSAALSSQCYRQIAFTYMEQGLFEQALACRDSMNEADSEMVFAAYMTYCADEAAIADLLSSVLTRLDKETAFNEDPEMTHKELVDAELAILGSYAEDLMYYDLELKELMASYLTGLETEASALNENGFWNDRSVWYAGNAMRYAVIETLIEKYDFLADEPAVQASFAGMAAQYEAFSALEKALDAQVLQAEAAYTDEDGDHYVFENTTGYAFALTLSLSFYDEEGELVLYHETEPLEIGVAETVKLGFLTPGSESWESCTITWSYEVSLN